MLKARASAAIRSRGQFVAAPFKGDDVEGLQTFNRGPSNFSFLARLSEDDDATG